MASEFFPQEPQSIEDTELSLLSLSELALKMLYVAGQMAGFELAQAMRLPFTGVVMHVLDFLKRERYCETRGAGRLGEGSYQYAITERGSAKAREVLWRNQYAGPAPVPLAVYTRAVQSQGTPRADINRSELASALSRLVLNPETVDALGPAIVSKHSLLIHGASGNGKTAVAKAIAQMLCTGTVYVPYAVEADGEIILVYDDAIHGGVQENDQPVEGNSPGERADRRWVRVQRPLVTLGAALRLESLDLYFDELSRCYVAPPQLKANGGIVLVDDLGRQPVPSQELLNRWMAPLDAGVDYLTLRTGRKLGVPFRGIAIFATHLSPADLADESLLRRIRHKVELRDPSFDEYREIFRRACSVRGIDYDETALANLIQKYYVRLKHPMRASHPDEILSRLMDIASFEGRQPALGLGMLERACRAHFGQGIGPSAVQPAG